MFSVARFFLLVLLASLYNVGLCERHAAVGQVHARSSSRRYGTISTSVDGSVLRATIDNPPINIYDDKLSRDLFALVDSLQNQSDVKVVVLASANPDFWIAHFDIHLLSASDPPPPPVNVTEVGVRLLATANAIATLPVIFIAEIDGRVTGAGNEIALQLDVRYAGPGARLSQFEVGFNLLPGAGGLQYLVTLIGRARALEYILSGRSVDATTAAAIGWVNRAFPTSAQLRRESDALARRIASFSGPALAAIKRRINSSSKPSAQSIADDNAVFVQLNSLPVAQAAVARYLRLSENQRGNAFELAVPANLEEFNG
ncbi:hypothetical protein MMC07_007124 [Pseudocyphellaria aurata]|nr:hypothetical protein [Pseudocyphellaria aurata]